MGSFVSNVNAHCKAFFTSSIQPLSNEYYRSISTLNAIAASNICFLPLNLLGEKVWGGESTFLTKGQNIIPLEKLASSSTSAKVYFLAAIFLIPGLVVGCIGRIVALIVNQTFRHHYRSIVTHFLPKQEICVPIHDVIKDALSRSANDMSFKDIAHLAQVDKIWNMRAKLIFLEKAQQYGAYNPHLTPQTLYHSVQAVCPEIVFDALGLEKILNLPTFEFTWINILTDFYQELQINKIIRTSDYSRFCFLATCQTQEGSIEAPLIIDYDLLSQIFNSDFFWIDPGRRTKIYLPLHIGNSGTAFYFDVSSVTSATISNLIQGKEVTLVGISGEQCIFKMPQPQLSGDKIT